MILVVILQVWVRLWASNGALKILVSVDVSVVTMEAPGVCCWLGSSVVYGILGELYSQLLLVK